MLRIITGPFHPDLEAALIDSLRSFKTLDPLTAVAIVVPSDSLKRRLQWRLCAEGGLVLLNTRVLTFHQLTIRLLEEAGAYDPNSVLPPLFFRELVHQVLREDAGDSPASYWRGLVEMPGAWAALWATLKDLKDAGVNAERVMDALESPDAPPDPGLAPLLKLYLRTRTETGGMRAYDHDDLPQIASEFVPASRFLGSHTHLLYYGFYDLTQIQLDMFVAVTRAVPTTLFFPLIRGHPAFAFATKFFDQFLHGLLGDPAHWIQIPTQGKSTPQESSLRRLFAVAAEEAPGVSAGREDSQGPAVQIVQASGREDEVAFVAKEILRLVEEQGYEWHQIGVVGRTLAGYETVLPRVFRTHGIPFATTLSVPLSAFPLVKTAVHLLDLKLNGYRRDLVIDLLSSPFLRVSALCPTEIEPRPDLWNVVSRRVGITKGLEEWERLAAFQESGLPLRYHPEGDETAAEGARVSGDHIRALLGCVTGLHAALSAVPDQGTWAEFITRTRDLWERLLVADAQGSESEPATGGDPAGVLTVFDACVEDLASLGRFTHAISLAEFVAALRRHVEEGKVPVMPEAEAGVQILDAMAARGQAFRALYVLALNERVFPRHIREDAFLRDASRRFLEIDLGFKIQEKLAGFEEEKLLFHMLVNAASERLTLLTLRSDDAGRALVPSLYLDEVRRLDGGLADADLAIPRRWTERWTHPRLPQFQPAWLTVPEWVQQRLLDRRLPPAALESSYPAGAFLIEGLQALRRLESSEATLGEQDGIVGVLPAYWRDLKSRGLSPTSLERYAKCPFHYFAAEVLKLEPLETPEAVGDIVPLEIGTLAHALLRAAFETLVARNYFVESGGSRPDPEAVVLEVAPPILDAYARTHPVGYPLLWDLQRENLITLITQVVKEDLDAMAQGTPGDWRPILFEAPLRGKLRIPLAGGPEEFALQGWVDRIDWSSGAREYRVIDYKYKAGTGPRSLDTNLARAAARGARLQPPFYLLMAEATLPQERPVEIGPGSMHAGGVWFRYLAPNWRRRETDPIIPNAEFPGDASPQSLRRALDRALAAMLSGIRSGEFFMYPGAHCDTCDFAALCRKSHQPSWWRARADHARVEPYRRLRRAEVEPQ